MSKQLALCRNYWKNCVDAWSQSLCYVLLVWWM